MVQRFANMENMIFDSHAHYDDEAFDKDRDELISSLWENGIRKVVNVGADMATTKASVALADKYDYVYAAVGVHPSDTGDMKEQDIGRLREYTTLEKVVAVGEIGLDYHYPEPDRAIQKKWFVRQLDLAVETGLSVIIHSREASADTFDILKQYEGRVTGVIHCYSYSPEMAKEYLKMGYYIGIGGVLTFKNARKLRETAIETPLERILVETDCPYLSPEPNRGKRNSSLNLKYVVAELARLKGISEEEVMRVTYDNAMKMYGIL